MRKSLLLAILATTMANAAFAAMVAPSATTVILVRHAEKAAAGPMTADVALSDAGVARAAELSHVLASAGVTVIYTTPYERTRRTAAPLAAKLGLQPVEIVVGKDYATQLATRIREHDAGRTILVVGHSNTTPDLIRALGGTAPDMPDTEYDALYVVTLSQGAPAKVVKLRYGAASQ